MDAVDFLERVGADARVRHGSGQALRELAGDWLLDAQLAAALLACDGDAVYRLLGQAPQMATQVPAEEEEAPEDDEEGADGGLPTVGA